jgi:hypothetical protein
LATTTSSGSTTRRSWPGTTRCEPKSFYTLFSPCIHPHLPYLHLCTSRYTCIFTIYTQYIHLTHL